jgi:hypothetical protein
MPGFAHGFHEGSRSEYLAQYIFSGFGTATPIPHQEDHGFDLYCTLAQREGSTAWADKPYTIQVKSGRERWKFKNRKSVEWFMKHSLPLFLCVVDKKKLRFSIFQTMPKYKFWTDCQPYPDRLELCPDRNAGECQCEVWQPGEVVSIGKPILDFTLDELARETFFERARAVLDSWLDVEYENLFHMAAKIRMWFAPPTYTTNQPLTENRSGRAYQLGNAVSAAEFDESLSRLRHIVAWLMEVATRQNDWRGAVRTALLLRHFFPKDDESRKEGDPRTPSYVAHFCSQLTRYIGVENTPYVYAYLDEIASKLDEYISPP